MKEEKIIKKYNELLDRIKDAEPYKLNWGYDIYTCECGKIMITASKDVGGTPFKIRCKCGKMLRHDYTLSEDRLKQLYDDSDISDIREWIRPSLNVILRMSEPQLKYLFNGGLFFKDEIIEEFGEY